MWKDSFCTNVHTTAHCNSLFCLHTVRLFPIHDFVTSYIDHLKNYWLTWIATINTFYYTLFSPRISSENSLLIGKLSESQWQSWVFQNYNFSLESLNFIFGNKHCQLIFLKWQSGAAHFKEYVWHSSSAIKVCR